MARSRSCAGVLNGSPSSPGYRYPGDAEEPPAEEAEGALAPAREVYEVVCHRLPPETRP